MAIKKSELYSSLWAGCDQLRGGMDAGQYKDYVLVLLFVKYVSDKYAGNPDALIEIPEGGSFRDMVALKGKKEIGDQINKIIGKLAQSNDLKGVIDVADFNDEDKLGRGKEMIDRLSNLIAIFENPALNFSKNRADGDDILGDAYEYLMKHFATQSGKSKGQFYTPAEVSRIIAKVIGINDVKEPGKSIYDPTCGSGSLLLKAVDETAYSVTIYGQEKDVATAALARMNMILHGNETAEIKKGQSTLSDPLFKDDHGYLKTFDFVVANPPFSSKNWMNGFDLNDKYELFKGYGMPPAKNGDYAFLLHIVKSLKSKGKGACILPHGVLFRGNAEAAIRKNLIAKGYIKGIIGLPANLFFGTGIPACIVVLDKENADTRKGIFMVDAGKGFIKDGNKNRLREQDIHKITDVFNKQTEIPGFSRMVPLSEISDPKNDYNLNIPRYIDSQETEDLQDIKAHLSGGIPNADIDALGKYWDVYPGLKTGLFENYELRMMNDELKSELKQQNYSRLSVHHSQLKEKIFSHPEFTAFSKEMDTLFETWKNRNAKMLKALEKGCKPKELIFRISEDLLAAYAGKKLIEKYDVYQHLMDFWNETLQDDCYLIAAEGWKAEPCRITLENKAGKKVDKGWTCDLVPKELMVNRFFLPEKRNIENLEAEREAIAAQMEEMKEEHSGEEGLLEEVKNDKGNISKVLVLKRQKEIKDDKNAAEERKVLKAYAKLIDREAETGRQIKTAENELDATVLERYKTLTEDEIKALVVDDKWMTNMEKSVKIEMARISQGLTQRIKELAERYETPLPEHNKRVADLEEKVKGHLRKMGFLWN